MLEHRAGHRVIDADVLRAVSLNVADVETDLLAGGRPHHTTGAAIKTVGGLSEDHRVPPKRGIGHVESVVVGRVVHDRRGENDRLSPRFAQNSRQEGDEDGDDGDGDEEFDEREGARA